MEIIFLGTINRMNVENVCFYFRFRQCLTQNNRTSNSPFSHHHHHQFTDLTNLIDYSPPSTSMSTNIFHDSDEINDANGNKKFIAKRAQIGKNNKENIMALIRSGIWFVSSSSRYDQTSD